jgi:thiamine biosynthesis protein ThiI
MEIEREIGRFVQSFHSARVDLESPECWIRIEVGEEHIYFSFEKQDGPGGLPQPLAGRVLALISGGIDSPVAAYQLMRRGCEVIFVHFHSAPYTSPASIAKVRRIVKLLNEYQMDSKLYVVGLGELQQKIVALAPPEDRVVLYRRAMIQIAERIARKEKALSLVTGEVLGQVASQTLTNLTIIEAATSLPLFRPLIGMDKREVVDLAKKIGTYPLSILPDQDCCSYMLPPSPTTRAKRIWIEQTENELSICDYMDKIISEAQSEHFTFGEESL